MRLSVVIPAYLERSRIAATIQHVCGYLSAQSYDWEVLVVVDGDHDGAAAVAMAAAQGRTGVRVLINEPNRGKGYSVRRGFAEANGDYQMIIDDDLSLPVEGLEPMLARLAAGADVAIGSRAGSGASEIGQSLAFRRLMSGAFNQLVQVLAVLGLRDTQCGLKGFTADAARTIFAAQEGDRFSFDVDVLSRARRRGLRIDKIPVTRVDHDGSSVRRVADGLRMLKEVTLVHWRHRRLVVR